MLEGKERSIATAVKELRDEINADPGQFFNDIRLGNKKAYEMREREDRKLSENGVDLFLDEMLI